MKNLIKILAISLIFMGLSAPILAQERGNTSPIIAVSKEAKAKLKTAQTIAVFLSGNDPLLTRIAEDTLAIYLTNTGFTVTNREMLEKSIGEQVVKKKKEKAESAINALEIGAAVNADAILTGTVIIESTEEKLGLVRIASFQLIEVSSGKTLLSILLQSEKGSTFTDTGKSFINILKQNRE